MIKPMLTYIQAEDKIKKLFTSLQFDNFTTSTNIKQFLPADEIKPEK